MSEACKGDNLTNNTERSDFADFVKRLSKGIFKEFSLQTKFAVTQHTKLSRRNFML